MFDWDGTAVPDRAADASELRALVEELCRLGRQLVITSGTHLENVDDQLRVRPDGPGRLYIDSNRGSEIWEIGQGGPVLRAAARDAARGGRCARSAAAARTCRRPAARGLATGEVSTRLNRRKLDLMPGAAWVDPPKSRDRRAARRDARHVARRRHRLAARGLRAGPRGRARRRARRPARHDGREARRDRADRQDRRGSRDLPAARLARRPGRGRARVRRRDGPARRRAGLRLADARRRRGPRRRDLRRRRARGRAGGHHRRSAAVRRASSSCCAIRSLGVVLPERDEGDAPDDDDGAGEAHDGDALVQHERRQCGRDHDARLAHRRDRRRGGAFEREQHEGIAENMPIPATVFAGVQTARMARRPRMRATTPAYTSVGNSISSST